MNRWKIINYTFTCLKKINLYLQKHSFPVMLPTLNGYQTLKRSIYVSKVHIDGKLTAHAIYQELLLTEICTRFIIKLHIKDEVGDLHWWWSWYSSKKTTALCEYYNHVFSMLQVKRCEWCGKLLGDSNLNQRHTRLSDSLLLLHLGYIKKRKWFWCSVLCCCWSRRHLLGGIL